MYTQEKCVFVKKDSIVTKSMSKVHIITLFWKNLEVEYLMFVDLKFAKFQKWQFCVNSSARLAGGDCLHIVTFKALQILKDCLKV